MEMILIIFLTCLLFFWLLVKTASYQQARYNKKHYQPGVAYYFRSRSAYCLPIRPRGLLNKEQLEKHEKEGYAVYIAIFDDQGRVIEFQKMVDGKLFFRHGYEYLKKGFVLHWEDADGKTGSKTYS